DYLEQLQKLRQMGPITQLMGMIPGMSKLQQQIDPKDAEDRLKKVEALIQSMTVEERTNPKVINSSRKRRIANGSGMKTRDVNELMKQYRVMRKMMKDLQKFGMDGIPGLGGGGLPGMSAGGSAPSGRGRSSGGRKRNKRKRR
ncbi:MAG: signal recognition particle protein, partial [Chloroflexota bacterium]